MWSKYQKIPNTKSLYTKETANVVTENHPNFCIKLNASIRENWLLSVEFSVAKVWQQRPTLSSFFMRYIKMVNHLQIMGNIYLNILIYKTFQTVLHSAFIITCLRLWCETGVYLKNAHSNAYNKVISNFEISSQSVVQVMLRVFHT